MGECRDCVCVCVHAYTRARTCKPTLLCRTQLRLAKVVGKGDGTVEI